MRRRKISAAVVLAAGRGERMHPLSAVIPKPALPLPQGPVVASALDLALDSGVSRIVVNAWHLSEKMVDAVSDLSLEDRGVVLSVEHELMGTAGGLSLARDRGLLGDAGSVLVINGDGDLDLAIDPVLDRHTRSDDITTLALLPHPDPLKWSQVAVDSSNHVTGISPPGTAPDHGDVYLYPGVMVISRESLNALPVEPGDIPDRLWWPALSDGKLGGVEATGQWHEVGTPSDYLLTVMRRLGGASWIHPTASVDPSAMIESSMIGRDARIEGGTEINASMVGEGALVRQDATVSNSIVLGKIEINQGTIVHKQIRAKPADARPSIVQTF